MSTQSDGGRLTLRRAEALLELGRADEARQQAAAFLAGDPQSPSGHVVMAQALHDLDRDREAVAAARRAIALDPGLPRAYLVLSSAQVALRDQPAAMATAQALIGLAPHDWTSHYALAHAMLAGDRPRFRDSLAVAGRALQLAPHVPATHNLIGICLGGLGRRAEARTAFQEALRLDPGHTNAMSNLADLEVNQGRLRHASARLRSALSIDPQHAGLQGSLDFLLVKLAQRLLWGLLLVGVVIGVEIVVEASWPVRAATGLALLGGIALALRHMHSHLPRGVSLWGRGLFGRVGTSAKRLLALTALAAVCLLFMSFAPLAVAAVAGSVLLVTLRVVGVLVIGGLVVRALVSLVRRG